MRAGFGVVDLKRVICSGKEEELARVVVVDGCVVQAWCLEELSRVSVLVRAVGVGWEVCTLVGLNIETTSLTFAAGGGPPSALIWTCVPEVSSVS